jgi:SAM-dependent methyltransferase
VDSDPEMLAVARQRAEAGTCEWVEADASRVPVAGETFDVVFGSTMLCFCPAPREAIREMVRLCRPGGRVLLGELNPRALWQLWRRAKGALGLGSFRGATWHRPAELVRLLEDCGCQVYAVDRAVFFPPLDVPDILEWRSKLERLGALLWRWAGAYYVIAAERLERNEP